MESGVKKVDSYLITRRKDVFGRGRNRYYISNNLIEFWFSMVWKNCASYEMNEVEFSESKFERYVEKKYKHLVKTLADKIIGVHVQRTGEMQGK